MRHDRVSGEVARHYRAGLDPSSRKRAHDVGPPASERTFEHYRESEPTALSSLFLDPDFWDFGEACLEVGGVRATASD